MAKSTSYAASGLSFFGPDETLGSLEWSHKFRIQYTDFQTGGLFPNSGTTTQNCTPLVTTAINDWVGNLAIVVVKAFAGTSLSALTVAIGGNGGTGLAANALCTTTAGNLYSATVGQLVQGDGTANENASGYFTAASALAAAFTSTGCNLSALSAGILDIYFWVKPIGSMNKITYDLV